MKSVPMRLERKRIARAATGDSREICTGPGNQYNEAVHCAPDGPDNSTFLSLK
jgi:hypothetical protein